MMRVYQATGGAPPQDMGGMGGAAPQEGNTADDLD